MERRNDPDREDPCVDHRHGRHGLALRNRIVVLFRAGAPMIHPSPIIAASDVVEIKAARPNVLNTNRSGRPFTERAGATPLNPSISNRALLEGFADVVRLQADRLQQSVIFALICMLVPTVIAVTVIGYAVLKPIY